jgi:hypothetical protein
MMETRAAATPMSRRASRQSIAHFDPQTACVLLSARDLGDNRMRRSSSRIDQQRQNPHDFCQPPAHDHPAIPDPERKQAQQNSGILHIVSWDP